MNYEIRKLSDDIIAILNASKVPAEAKRMIVVNLASLLEKEADKAILLEMGGNGDGDLQQN